ncbi:MAG: M15 family metallopeptidase [Nocardioides sp.]
MWLYLRKTRCLLPAICLVGLSACGSQGQLPRVGAGAATPEVAGSSGATLSDGSPSGSSTLPPSVGPTGNPRSGDPTPAGSPVLDPAHTMAPPQSLNGVLSGADLLIYGQQPLSDQVLTRIDELARVTDAESLSVAQVAVQDRILQVAAVDPATYWRFNPRATAEEAQVWARVAGGEISVSQKVGEALQDESGHLRLGNDQSAPEVHIGAYAPQVPQIDAVVNSTWVETLGMRPRNAILVETGTAAPRSVRPEIQKIVGPGVSVQILGPDLDITVQQTAYLTGGSVAAAVGSFSYSVLGGGRIAPDPAWVKANIRTETIPILGSVTCHRVVLPQLRAAFTEIQARGLADKIYPDQYAGCFYPRFIAGSTQLSLHSFGIALDLNVPGNQRGTVGEMDRTIVSIFKKWGFAWGGDWNYTDPMHFEMDRLVRPR